MKKLLTKHIQARLHQDNLFLDCFIQEEMQHDERFIRDLKKALKVRTIEEQLKTVPSTIMNGLYANIKNTSTRVYTLSMESIEEKSRRRVGTTDALDNLETLSMVLPDVATEDVNYELNLRVLDFFPPEHYTMTYIMTGQHK